MTCECSLDHHTPGLGGVITVVLFAECLESAEATLDSVIVLSKRRRLSYESFAFLPRESY